MLKPSALLSLRMNMSGVGILPARKYIETGKMPVPPRCQFHQDASSTKMPVPPRCPFHQDAHSTKLLKSSRIYRLINSCLLPLASCLS
ncbi:hypothetical protein [Moorena sp. SIO3H5]|uniref:hypothetical protein n=1 Tax=Moorena sp. SIO3H5 TaxID=2607834 RepID=UPI0013BA0563|nr:hypothetical protein [Moorena sp. SIO3H5]NEO73595.1 hypothetical protein [Moorena sp. SIO3H5]